MADERLIKGDESGAAVYSHIAKVIDAALKELDLGDRYTVSNSLRNSFLS